MREERASGSWPRYCSWALAMRSLISASEPASLVAASSAAARPVVSFFASASAAVIRARAAPRRSRAAARSPSSPLRLDWWAWSWIERLESSSARTLIRSDEFVQLDAGGGLGLALLAELFAQPLELDRAVGAPALVGRVDIAPGDGPGGLDQVAGQRDEADPTHLGAGVREVVHDDRLAEDVAEGGAERLVKVNEVDRESGRPCALATTRDLPWGRPGSILLSGRKVARPRFSCRSIWMHCSATWSVSTTRAWNRFPPAV